MYKINFCLALMHLHRIINYYFKKVNPEGSMSNHTTTQEDSDVANERLRLSEALDNQPLFDALVRENSLVVIELTKRYSGGLLAVDRLSIGVEPGECFGLLGINGAGKTSTFQMLTGDSIISSGEAWIDGYNIKKDIRKVGVVSL